MSDKKTWRLNSPTARQMASRSVANADEGWICQLGPPSRSGAANAMLHAMLSEVAKQGTFQGKRLMMEQWKVLFISAHAQATGEGAQIVHGLEDELVNIRESSAKMPVARMNSLIEYLSAWCAEHEIHLAAQPGYEEFTK